MKCWVKPGLPFTKLNRIYTQNLEKINFDMFYKNYCWAVICYPICVTNVSYERKIIVLPFPVISFVILIFVFQIFEIKSGFPFYCLTLYIHGNITAFRNEILNNPVTTMYEIHFILHNILHLWLLSVLLVRSLQWKSDINNTAWQTCYNSEERNVHS